MENRITELEIKVAYQEDTIQQLDRVICQQQDQMDLLKKQIRQLLENTHEPNESTGDLQSIVDETPPHY
ncbi:MAG TPA: SlyX family protein [Cycloclasticus sp.]|jgi:SlyX protein|nr:SlyX family protein [Cycloclasticus sp.]HIL92566.1 SlyX family protein [Cycloclasticus sp.]